MLQLLDVKNYGVLGTSDSGTTGTLPGPGAAIVDPAGLLHIQSLGPAGSTGGSGAIYNWLGIAGQTSFPRDVKDGVRNTLDAKAHVYPNGVTVIHVVGPNFASSAVADMSQAVDQLQEAYANVFREFDQSDATTLRLIPISGGVNAGRFQEDMPQITFRALNAGFRSLPLGVRSRLIMTKFWAHKAELCLFAQSDYAAFNGAYPTFHAEPELAVVTIGSPGSVK
jgi:hypothetical protein